MVWNVHPGWCTACWLVMITSMEVWTRAKIHHVVKLNLVLYVNVALLVPCV